MRADGIAQQRDGVEDGIQYTPIAAIEQRSGCRRRRAGRVGREVALVLCAAAFAHEAIPGSMVEIGRSLTGSRVAERLVIIVIIRTAVVLTIIRDVDRLLVDIIARKQPADRLVRRPTSRRDRGCRP